MNIDFLHDYHLDDIELKELFAIMEKEDLVAKMFYDGKCKDAHTFMTYIREQAWFLLPVDAITRKALGAIWLDGFRHMTAFIHLVKFKAAGDHTLEIGLEVLEYLKAWLLGKVNTLVGYVPASHVHHRSLYRKLGANELGAIPKAIQFEDGRIDDAYFYTIEL